MSDKVQLSDRLISAPPPMEEDGDGPKTTVILPDEETDEKTLVLGTDSGGRLIPRTLSVAAPASADSDYTLCGKIGDGGMGIVYLARDRRLGRYVAIKRLNDRAMADPTLRARFLQEARAVATLNHAYIVHIYALGEDRLGPYIVMEYVSGPPRPEDAFAEGSVDGPHPPRNLSLESYIRQNGPMTAEEAIAMELKIARTIVYAHGCGVIHRDLKPANILLDPSGEPKLVDFGLARIAPREDDSMVPEELTVPGEKLISLGYSAPELEQDASTSDGRADIYSLGAILYFLLTGRNPRYYREQDVPAFLREVMRRSLETVREQRFRTAQDFVHALGEAASHGKTVAPTVKTTWRCKWCDAVNPITTRYCAECGWDGSEHCPECGAETFIGQQYCSSCGADCRMYEHVASIIEQMNRTWEDRHFERIPTIAGRLHGFEPAGPNGRRILAEAQDRVEEAERRIARRNRLATLIPNELRAENFERARTFIEEFRELNEDPLVYEEELRDIPMNILRRDLVRIRQCMRSRDWATARHLIGDLAPKYGDVPEYQDVRSILQKHVVSKCRRLRVLALAVTFFLYLLSLPWAARLSGGVFGPVAAAFYTPARFILGIPGIRYAADAYVRIASDRSDVYACFIRESVPTTEISSAETLPLPNSIMPFRIRFDQLLRELAERSKSQTSGLLMQYSQKLTDLRRAAQQAGNYEEVVAADRAIAEYAESNTFGTVSENDPASLASIKRRYALMRDEQAVLSARQIISATRRYIAALDEAQRSYTQQGQMEPAGIVARELARVRKISEVTAAETLIAHRNELSPAQSLNDETHLAEPSISTLDLLRTSREKFFAKLDTERSNAEKSLGDWGSQYIAAIQSLMGDFQRSGNFNAWEAAAAELLRFESNAALSESDLLEFPEELHRIQETFITRLRSAEVGSRQALIGYCQTYIARLEKIKSDFTKQGKMTDASAVNQELKNIRKDPRMIEIFRPEPERNPAVPAAVSAEPSSPTTIPSAASAADSKE